MPGLDTTSSETTTIQFSPAIQLELGMQAFFREKDALAFGYFRSAAEKGLPLAHYYVGWLYENGNCFSRDAKSHSSLLQSAIYWYELAAKKHVPEAQNHLGTLFEQGKGVAKNPIKAARMYQLSAIQGFADGLKNFARVLEGGCGLKKNEKVAAECYRRLAKKGDAGAQFKFASLVLEGKGVEKNERRALKWCTLAAKQDYPPAVAKLDALRMAHSKDALLASAHRSVHRQLKPVEVITSIGSTPCFLS